MLTNINHAICEKDLASLVKAANIMKKAVHEMNTLIENESENNQANEVILNILELSYGLDCLRHMADIMEVQANLLNQYHNVDNHD